MRPGSTVVCIDARDSCWFLHVGMRLVVQDVVHTDDGRIMVSFVGGPECGRGSNFGRRCDRNRMDSKRRRH